jgi:hypothetical protein
VYAAAGKRICHRLCPLVPRTNPPPGGEFHDDNIGFLSGYCGIRRINLLFGQFLH